MDASCILLKQVVALTNLDVRHPHAVWLHSFSTAKCPRLPSPGSLHKVNQLHHQSGENCDCSALVPTEIWIMNIVS
jgi:hypothetical protein